MAYFGRSGTQLGPTGTKIIFAVFMVVFGVIAISEYIKYRGLSENGKETTATVISCNTVVTHGRHGSTTHFYHILSFDGLTQRVELYRSCSPGTKISIVYLPAKPSVAVEGKKGMSEFELMGTGNIMMLVFFGGFAVFYFLMIFGIIPMQQTQYSGVTAPSGGAGIMQDFSEPRQETGAIQGNSAPAPVPFKPGPPEEGTPAENSRQEPLYESGPPGTIMQGYDAAVDVRLAYIKDPSIAVNTTITALIRKKEPSLDERQAAAAHDRAKALIAAAEEMADDISDGIFTREQAVDSLVNSNPGFSRQKYEAAVDKAVEGA